MGHVSTGEEETRQPRQFGGLGGPAVPDDFDAALPEDELAAWEGIGSTPSIDQAQRDALTALAGAEHLDDLQAVVTGRKLGEALGRLGPLDPDIEADIAAALAAVGVPYTAPDREQAALEETAEILADPELMATIREAAADVAAGRVVTTSELIAAWRRGPEPSTAGWTRDQRRSLWLAAAIAGRIVADPERAREAGRRNLNLMRTTGGPRARTDDIDAWASLLDGPLEQLLAMLTGTTERSRDLRQQNPFAGLLDQDERRTVLRAFRAADGLPLLPEADENVSLAAILRADDDIDLDAVLAETRAATDTGRRTDLDDAIHALGYDRADLEVENTADAADDPELPKDGGVSGLGAGRWLLNADDPDGPVTFALDVDQHRLLPMSGARDVRPVRWLDVVDADPVTVGVPARLVVRDHHGALSTWTTGPIRSADRLPRR